MSSRCSLSAVPVASGGLGASWFVASSCVVGVGHSIRYRKGAVNGIQHRGAASPLFILFALLPRTWGRRFRTAFSPTHDGVVRIGSFPESTSSAKTKSSALLDGSTLRLLPSHSQSSPYPPHPQRTCLNSTRLTGAKSALAKSALSPRRRGEGFRRLGEGAAGGTGCCRRCGGCPRPRRALN